jgi:hypothetical protein
MRFVHAICIVLLLTHAGIEFAHAQETIQAAPQNSSPPVAEGKQRTEEETRKHLEQLACGPSGVHFLQHTEKGQQVLPEQPVDKGLVYVIRTKAYEGAMVQAKLAMDAKWVGVNRMANYFYIEVDPGPHYFCLKAGVGPDTIGLLSLVIERGKTYYLRQNLTLGGNDLDLLDEAEGKKYVARYHRSVFEVHPKK